MKRSADISSDGLYRWRLERRWGDGTSVCWIMLNPSTADAEKDDPTIRRVMAFSKAWGHDAAIVVNLFPFRSSDPGEVRRWVEEKGYQQPTSWPPNMLAILEAADASAFIVCAWGAPTWARFRAKQVLGGLGQGYSLYCLGANADGSPKHPLARGRARVPNNQEPLEFVAMAVVAGPRERAADVLTKEILDDALQEMWDVGAQPPQRERVLTDPNKIVEMYAEEKR